MNELLQNELQAIADAGASKLKAARIHFDGDNWGSFVDSVPVESAMSIHKKRELVLAPLMDSLRTAARTGGCFGRLHVELEGRQYVIEQ